MESKFVLHDNFDVMKYSSSSHDSEGIGITVTAGSSEIVRRDIFSSDEIAIKVEIDEFVSTRSLVENVNGRIDVFIQSSAFQGSRVSAVGTLGV